MRLEFLLIVFIAVGVLLPRMVSAQGTLSNDCRFFVEEGGSWFQGSVRSASLSQGQDVIATGAVHTRRGEWVDARLHSQMLSFGDFPDLLFEVRNNIEGAPNYVFFHVEGERISGFVVLEDVQDVSGLRVYFEATEGGRRQINLRYDERQIQHSILSDVVCLTEWIRTQE